MGLVVTSDGSQVNVLSAEWTYFVAKDPVTVAVVLHESNWTTERLGELSEFSVTLCSDEQASAADFCGSFSGKDVPKVSSEEIALGDPVANSTPWVREGVMALECTVVQRVELPHYIMVIGEVRHVHGQHDSPRPLVKHDAMHSIGSPIARTRVTVGAGLVGGQLRVCAVASADPSPDEPYEVVLLDGDEVLEKHVCPPNAYGDLDCLISIEARGHGPVTRVSVGRAGHEPGFATL